MKTNNALYFPHCYNSRNSGNILKLRAKFENGKAFGTYWMLAEMMHESSDGFLDASAIDELSLSLNIEKEYLTRFIEYAIKIGAFKKVDSRITAEKVAEHKKFREQKRKDGIKGAKTRWQDHSTAIATPIARKEKKVNEIKEKRESVHTHHTPPTLLEAKQYFKELGNETLADDFIDHFTSNGWKVGGRSPMKDWKAAARRWKRNENNFKKGGGNGEYDDEDDRILARISQRTPESI